MFLVIAKLDMDLTIVLSDYYCVSNFYTVSMKIGRKIIDNEYRIQFRNYFTMHCINYCRE